MIEEVSEYNLGSALSSFIVQEAFTYLKERKDFSLHVSRISKPLRCNYTHLDQ